MNMDVSTCSAKKADGTKCKNRVKSGQRTCWHHSHGLKQKYRAFTRSQLVVFWLTMLFGVATLVGLDPIIKNLFTEAQTHRDNVWNRLSAAPRIEGGDLRLTLFTVTN